MGIVGFSRKGAWEFETSLNLAFELLGASLLVAMRLCHRLSSISILVRVIKHSPVLDLSILLTVIEYLLRASP